MSFDLRDNQEGGDRRMCSHCFLTGLTLTITPMLVRSGAFCQCQKRQRTGADRNLIREMLYIYESIAYPSTVSAIYDALRHAIAESGKTRYRLWQETGISQSQLCEFLHGHRGMKIDTLELLAKALGLEIVVQPAKRKRGR